MPLVTAILTGLLMGAAFGLALEKSRVFEPGMIVGQMQLRNFIMLKVFLTAVATGAVALAALNGFGLVKLQPVLPWRAPVRAPFSRRSGRVIATPSLP